MPMRFEAKISSFKDSKDLTRLTMKELVNTFQAQKYRKAMKLEELEVEACLLLHEKKTNNYGGKK